MTPIETEHYLDIYLTKDDKMFFPLIYSQPFFCYCALFVNKWCIEYNYLFEGVPGFGYQ